MSGRIAAMQAAFGTNELLEIILAFIPLEDVPVLQTVSWTWKGTIQRRLDYWIHQRPTPGLPAMALVLPYDSTDLASGTVNCIPVEQMPKSSRGAHLTTANPLLLARPAMLASRSMRCHVQSGDFVEFKENLSKYLISERRLSCDDMFLTQPPACYMLVRWYARPSRTFKYSRRGGRGATLENPTGVRLKDLRVVLRSRGVVEWKSLELFAGICKSFHRHKVVFATEDEVRELTGTYQRSGGFVNVSEAQRGQSARSSNSMACPSEKKEKCTSYDLRRWLMDGDTGLLKDGLLGEDCSGGFPHNEQALVRHESTYC